MTNQEIAKCNKVVDLFKDMLDKKQDMCLLYSHDFGVVVLEYFQSGGFERNTVYANAESLFQHLLNKWKFTWIIEHKKESEIDEFDEFVELMPENLKNEFEQQVEYFEQKYAQIV